MTTEQLYALIVGILVITALAAGLRVFMLWLLSKRKAARRSDRRSRAA